MTSLYTDEDVDVLLKPLLNAKGFTVFTALGERMLGKSDEEQLEHAIKLKCTFFTHNRIHFEKLAVMFLEDNKEHYGIIMATIYVNLWTNFSACILLINTDTNLSSLKVNKKWSPTR